MLSEAFSVLRGRTKKPEEYLDQRLQEVQELLQHARSDSQFKILHRMSENIDTISTNIGTISTKIATISTNIDTMSTNMATISTNMATVATKMNEISHNTAESTRILKRIADHLGIDREEGNQNEE